MQLLEASVSCVGELHQLCSPAAVCVALLQLADFLRGPLERAGGMMPLPDVYCMYNRWEIWVGVALAS